MIPTALRACKDRDPGGGKALPGEAGARYERHMLRGALTGLRARVESDVEILHAELYDDVAVRVRADSRPWVPLPAGPGSPFQVPDAEDYDAALVADTAVFSVVVLDGGDLAGDAMLWGIDLHNRSAHVGVALRPAFRGRGLGTDALRVLCQYGFEIRGLHRLQLETLTDNHAMARAAEQAGFRREGTLRASDWVAGSFADVVIFGLLQAEWRGGTGGVQPPIPPASG
jgi:RimJ/RimL family protein N-acetyltransferase